MDRKVNLLSLKEVTGIYYCNCRGVLPMPLLKLDFFGFIHNRKFTNNSSRNNQTTGYPEAGFNYHLKI